MEAATYAAGLQLFESARDRVSLIVADVCLEDGSGRELVRRLRSLKPNLKAILTTGYDPHQMRGKIDLQPDELFLAKPFQTDGCLPAIESLLQPHQSNRTSLLHNPTHPVDIARPSVGA